MLLQRTHVWFPAPTQRLVTFSGTRHACGTKHTYRQNMHTHKIMNLRRFQKKRILDCCIHSDWSFYSSHICICMYKHVIKVSTVHICVCSCMYIIKVFVSPIQPRIWKIVFITHFWRIFIFPPNYPRWHMWRPTSKWIFWKIHFLTSLLTFISVFVLNFSYTPSYGSLENHYRCQCIIYKSSKPVPISH